MMSNKRSTIHLSRLTIYSKGSAVYDERFLDGINIIRGRNSSGKSTIINFIYFILGGDLRRWTPQAEDCDVVIAEVSLSGVIFTLKREVDSSRRSLGMYIFFGELEKALSSAIDGWVHYSFSRTENKLSFSQLLFNALGLPEVKSDLESAITMHQILRVIFVDQLDVPDTLVRYEKFDSKLTCSTIGDILYGVYDDALYEEQKRLSGIDKELSMLSTQIESLEQALRSITGENILRIEKLYTDTEDQLLKIESSIHNLKNEVKLRYINNSSKDLEKNQQELIAAKNNFNAFYNNASELKLEIEDSDLFINALEKQKEALNYSIKTRKALGELTLTNCPSCLSKLLTATEGNCNLCGQPDPVDTDKSQAFRMLQEIEMQIKESNLLQKKRYSKLAELEIEFPILKKKVNDLQKIINKESNESNTTLQNELEKLYIQKGKIQSELDHLANFKKSYYAYNELVSKKSRLTVYHKSIKESIEARIDLKDRRANKVKATVQKYTLEILRNDNWQSEFKTANYTTISFEKNSFSLDGRSSFSASSLVYLKNAIRFAIFFASLELDFMRYPRFILCDNIEDKGMEELRSQQFQRTIVEIASRFNKEDYQIIYSTSMVEPAFDNEVYCIGEKYDEGNKSLKFKSLN